MKLSKRLFIENEEVALTSNKVSLKLSLGSKAVFVIKSKQPLAENQAVRFDIGYQENTAPWFEGFIEKIQPAPNGYQKIVVKEYAGILSQRWTVSIEHPTIADILKRLSDLTGLEFKLPEAEYTKAVIPNFVSQGDGYQCLEQIAKAFNIDDCVWFQDVDQQIYFGSYQHSHFYNKPMSVPSEFSTRQNANSFTFVPFPMIRPGRTVNGNRITKIELFDDEMTAHWLSSQNEVPAKKRETLDSFPELAAGYHLPKFGRVEAVRDTAKAGQTADPFRPRYAIDVQVLDENMMPDISVPVYRSVPLSVNMSGHESGLLAYPLEGTLVEIAFAYGRNDRPIIRGMYGREYALPTIAPGEQLQQQREEVSRRVDAAGNTTEKTDQRQTQEAFAKHDKADRYQAEFGQHSISVDEHSKENIIGKKLIEALGAIELLAGDNIELGSLSNMHIATAGEMIQVIGKLRNIVIAQDDKLKVMGNRLEVIEKDWEASAKNMRFTADLITMNGGKGVVQGDCICQFTGLPHSDVSATVKAGK
ncbi:hypothetical protein EAY27_13195 [Vibrio anguillarum]|uniref:hypothetical protein n=1 Tax=Vibrio anguillarum TaxID=55601 RepID=UPI00188D8DCF|nr:hypothetical protein [Vibrio anguillarum]MBF4257514.1 hypothetical protein [Vibrio anguillarum]MBF4278137.1 hypothetical protein [Vibrio anguillarum]MBF4300529.1 hypothetical protein [Vibrio anguillarum]MBF4398039.1 hypothetical protein [Vibrio anguillarum]MBF4440078.1 hypothetical protein [Vibrio anguillarum]